MSAVHVSRACRQQLLRSCSRRAQKISLERLVPQGLAAHLLPLVAAAGHPCVAYDVPSLERKAARQKVLACSAELASVQTEENLIRKSFRTVRAMLRALLLLIGWTPLVATGLTINLLNRVHLVPSAIIEAWWSTGE